MDDRTQQLMDRARSALPPVEGEVRVPGLRQPVEIIRDRWGVPHIYASDRRDLFFAASYVVTSERLFQQDLLLRLANGRLATIIGPFGLSFDRFFRTVGLNRAGRAIAGSLDGESREIYQASLAGANAWIETMPAPPIEYQVLGMEPEPLPTGEEGEAYCSAFSAFMGWTLSGNWDAELLRAELAESLGWDAMRDLFPELPAEPWVAVPGKDGGWGGRRAAWDILRTAPLHPSGQGSNNWVVGPSRSVTGRPLLANDPHLVAQLPSIWFEAHLSAPGIEVSGVSLPLFAGIQIGHSDRLAWGLTNVGGDTQDLYLERLNQDRTAALYDGRWEPVTVHREEIRVRGQSDPEILKVVETRHGPLVDSYMVGAAAPEVVTGGIGETYALRWTGHTSAVSPGTMYRMAVARTVAEFREALRGWHCPGQNVVYADREGNIAYQCTGMYPLRRRGDGTLPVPGWTSEYEWDGYIPFEELPWALNPEQGFLATANQKIHDEAYPHLIGKDFLPPYRARRIVEMITGTARHSPETFARMHLDTVSIPAREMLPLLLEMDPADERQKQALAMLREWDGDIRADSGAACIFETWCRRIAEAILLPRLGPSLYEHYHARRQWSLSFQFQVLPNLLAYPTARWFGRDGRDARDDMLRGALGEALQELTARLGEDLSAWEWGSIHAVRFAGPLSAMPDLADLMFGGEAPWGGDEQTVCQGMYEPGSRDGDQAVVIPSWRQILDLSDWDRSVGTHTVGQSGNPASPHFRDLFPLWAGGRYHPLPFSREAVERFAESRLHLVSA